MHLGLNYKELQNATKLHAFNFSKELGMRNDLLLLVV